MEEKLIHVAGRVQGVGYRAFAKREAAGLGLTGFARNLPDGRVELLVQGEEAAAEVFIERLKEGPLLADVDDLVISARTPGAAYSSFEVR